MDRRTQLREKLSELTSGSAHQREDRWSYEAGQRLRELWRRFQSLSVLERVFIVGCSVLAVILIPVAAVLLTSGGDDDAAAAYRPRPTATAVTSVGAEPTDVDPNAGPTPTPFRVSVRRNCDLIRGTEYRSEAERKWFEEHCIEPTPEPTEPGPTATPRSSGGNPQPPPPPPPPAPSPDDGFTAGDAIAAASSWMATQAGASYEVIEGSCSAVWISDHWVVSCTVALEGCSTAVCRETLSACAFDAPVRVVPTAQC